MFVLEFMCAPSLSHVLLLLTSWTIAHRAPLSMGYPRQGYWSRLPFPPPGNLPGTEIKLTSPASPALEGRSFTTEPPGKPYTHTHTHTHTHAHTHMFIYTHTHTHTHICLYIYIYICLVFCYSLH